MQINSRPFGDRSRHIWNQQNAMTYPALMTSVGCAYTTLRDHALAQGALRRCPKLCSSLRGASPSRQGVLLGCVASLLPWCRHAACSLCHPVHQHCNCCMTQDQLHTKGYNTRSLIMLRSQRSRHITQMLLTQIGWHATITFHIHVNTDGIVAFCQL